MSSATRCNKGMMYVVIRERKKLSKGWYEKEYWNIYSVR